MAAEVSEFAGFFEDDTHPVMVLYVMTEVSSAAVEQVEDEM